MPKENSLARLQKYRAELSQKPPETIRYDLELLKVYLLFPKVIWQGMAHSVGEFLSSVHYKTPYSQSTELLKNTIIRLRYLKIESDRRVVIEEEGVFPDY